MRKRVVILTILASLVLSTSAMAATYNYYLPYFIGGNGWWTAVALKNQSTTGVADVTVSVYSPNGQLLSTEHESFLPKGQGPFIVGQGITGTGWVLVESTQPLNGLCFFAYTSAGMIMNMADEPFTSTLAKRLDIPHVGQGPVNDTTVMVCNPRREAVVVTLEYLDSNGYVMGRVTKTIPAEGSWTYDLYNMPNRSSNYGSVSIVASTGVAAFALYQNLKTGGQAFAGISAVTNFDGVWDVRYTLTNTVGTRSFCDIWDDDEPWTIQSSEIFFDFDTTTGYHTHTAAVSPKGFLVHAMSMMLDSGLTVLRETNLLLSGDQSLSGFATLTVTQPITDHGYASCLYNVTATRR